MRIIAVDDEKGALRLLLRAILKAAPNADVEGFNNPEEAIASMHEKMADVAFLDIKMGNVSGMNLAEDLYKLNPNINIIFTTGYQEYAKEAFDLRASGYILKPVSQSDVEKELSDLRNPTKEMIKGVYIQTFGGFEVFVDGDRVKFNYEKTRELLAYIFNKQGVTVTIKELESELWEQGNHESYIRRIKKDLTDTLKKYNCESILVKSRGVLGLNFSQIRSDYQDLLNGGNDAVKKYNGDYMERYSWAEERNAHLMMLF